jgi:hypothetical protein
MSVIGDSTHYGLELSALRRRSSRTPVVRNTAAQMGAATGSTYSVKLPKRRRTKPGIGRGSRNITIPQSVNQIIPKEISASPAALRMVAIVAVPGAVTVAIRRLHLLTKSSPNLVGCFVLPIPKALGYKPDHRYCNEN